MDKKIVVTGATGFIGRRLVDSLLEDGYSVRAISRRMPSQTGLPTHERLEVVQADVLDTDQLASVLEGASAAYYLIHSMEGSVGNVDDFIEKDRKAAIQFGRHAKKHGLDHILYLSGLVSPESDSAHLSSRLEVERCLAKSKVPLTVIRAGFIIGPQSAGFRMLQGLTNAMNTMLIDPSMHHKTQPAFVDDVINALVLCLAHPTQTKGHIFDVGARETTTYFEMIQSFCRHRNKKVSFIEVPWVPRELASVYIANVSHLSYALVVSLSHGLSSDLVVQNESIYHVFPQLERTSPDDSLKQSVQALMS